MEKVWLILGYIYLLGLLIIRAACGSSRHLILNFFLVFFATEIWCAIRPRSKEPPRVFRKKTEVCNNLK